MKNGELMIRNAAPLDRNDEKQLILRARSGDRLALRELVDRHKDRLFAFIWRMVRHHHDAEEICQDAFLKAFASLDSFSTEFRFSTWLFTIGYRVCLNHLRRKKHGARDAEFDVESAESDNDNDGVWESEEAERLRTTVWQAVERLSPPQRAALLLFYRQNLSCHEIARVLEVPVATVKSHLHRARWRLRELLEPVTDAEIQEFRNRSASAG